MFYLNLKLQSIYLYEKSLSTCNISNNYLVILVVIYMNLFLCIRES